MERGQGRKQQKQMFEEEIDKLELLRERYPVSFRQAKAALDASQGSLVDALAYLEEAQQAGGAAKDPDLKKGHARIKRRSQEMLDAAVKRTKGYLDQPLDETMDRGKHMLDETIEKSNRMMDETMDRAGYWMDEVKERTRDYADEAMDRSIDFIEERRQQAAHRAKHFWHYVQDSAVAVKRGDEVVARIPATVGLVGLAGTILSSRLALVGAFSLAGALGSGYSLEMQQVGHAGEHHPEH